MRNPTKPTEAGALREPEPAPAPDPQEEAVQTHRTLRNTVARGMAGVRLLAALERPASQMLPDRPHLQVADEGCRNDPSLLEYVAMAIESGNAAALDAIADKMRMFVKRGAKDEDWPTILREYRYTWQALHTLATEWAAGVRETELSNKDLVHRLGRASFDVRAIAEASVRDQGAIARRLVASEQHVSPLTIAKMWKQRRQILPAEDWLLENKTKSTLQK